ncbi:AraC family transcriptional regulator [Alkalihalobacillus sp. MEB130]|uniref:AraC family transcriptional regulator n=1 Tax=Alkalihalobacillus sp. MEB130 TaxID=2976704 RepID=UPI0028DFC6C3|nr:AraC family transcriptional regulator [Alkalihalobacillus sp. MEB130]MDT8859269.1 AraC family transcriptional regulator [Alkalihalobacillus sp. MEB130]
MNYYIPKVEPGLKTKKGLYFYEPSELTKKLYFYVMWGGEYIVDAPYSIRRDYMDSFLVFYIKRGSMQFHYLDQSFVASKGDIVLLDCKEKNNYSVTEEAEFQFIHFAGKGIQDLYNEIYQRNGALYRLPSHKNNIPTILSLLASDQEIDFNISLEIYQLLGNLLESTRSTFESRDANMTKIPPEIQAAVTYINENFSSKITIEKLSEISNLSTSHFCRTFKKYMGTSPYQYLLNYRLIQAKNLLVQTNLSVEQISEDCGFYGIGHFIKAFSKSTGGMTPGKFRKLCF